MEPLPMDGGMPLEPYRFMLRGQFGKHFNGSATSGYVAEWLLVANGSTRSRPTHHFG